MIGTGNEEPPNGGKKDGCVTTMELTAGQGQFSLKWSMVRFGTPIEERTFGADLLYQLIRTLMTLLVVLPKWPMQ